MSEASETLRADIKRYQDLVEKLRIISLNKQQLQVQLSEITNALKELEASSEDTATFEIVGSIMIAKKRDSLIDKLKSLQETMEIRLKTLEKQEDLLKKQLSELEKKLTRKLGGSRSLAG